MVEVFNHSRTQLNQLLHVVTEERHSLPLTVQEQLIRELAEVKGKLARVQSCR